MTTDVAAAAPTDEPIAPAEPVAPATETQAPPAGGVAEPEAQAEAAPAAAAEFDVTSLPEYQEVVKAPDPEIAQAAAAPEMPGEPVGDVLERMDAQRADFVRGFMQAADPDIRDYLTRELGLAPQDAHQLWHGKLGPILRGILQGNAAYNRTVFHEAVNAELPQDAQQDFYSQVYPNQAKAVKGVYTAGVKSERKTWEQKLAKGDLMTKAQATKIANAAYSRGLGQTEQSGAVEGAESGQVLNGTPANRASEDARLADPNTPISEVQAILARRGM